MKNNTNKPNLDSGEYFSISNVTDFETLGRVYAGMNNDLLSDDIPEEKQKELYEKLGKALYKRDEGVFYEGNYYGKNKNAREKELVFEDWGRTWSLNCPTFRVLTNKYSA